MALHISKYDCKYSTVPNKVVMLNGDFLSGSGGMISPMAPGSPAQISIFSCVSNGSFISLLPLTMGRDKEITTKLKLVNVTCTSYGWEVITEGLDLIGDNGVIGSYRPMCRRGDQLDKLYRASSKAFG